MARAKEWDPFEKSPCNVVLIVADDLGWSDLACYGSDLHETPHLDQLARQGTRFTDAYSASPVCSPTRAAMLTGKHPARLGLTIWREAALNPPKGLPFLPARSIADLPHAEVTIAAHLQKAGYLTALVGKWHLGDGDHAPQTHGFDVNIGGTHWGAPPSYFFPYRGPFGQAKEPRYVPHLEFGQPGEYLTDRLTSEAIRVIDRAALTKQPFFLCLAHHAPHTPIEAKSEWVQRYEKKVKPNSQHKNPTYAAMIHSLDESVGRVLESLEKNRLTSRTLVIFTSDNGGQIGTYAARTVTSNAPLRSGKGSLYEGGVRVPLILTWPTVTTAGSVCREPVTSTDLFFTILDAAKVPIRDETPQARDGVSLVPLLKDTTARLNRQGLHFHYPHHYATTTPVSAVRAGDWKLLEYLEDGRLELYHLKDDLGESNNLVETSPQKAKEMLHQLQTWRKSVQAQMPTPNPDFKRNGG